MTIRRTTCRATQWRLQAPPRTLKMAEEYVNFLASEAVPKAMSLDEVTRATLNNKMLQAVAEFIYTDGCHEVENTYDLDTTAVGRFAKVKDEMTVQG